MTDFCFGPFLLLRTGIVQVYLVLVFALPRVFISWTFPTFFRGIISVAVYCELIDVEDVISFVAFCELLVML